ncbi:MAG: Cof-type HAD-IIB family hydrolase [Methylobacteriaceae bacterium]|nr:Cof-type HAD-IIB family hydrolase [Methylobacteriaceae bacterium]
MSRISLVLSDVDGTLVTTEKQLTDATIAAVMRLADHGIRFTVTSSRPPFGLRALVDRLHLRFPLGAFNGGCLVEPDLTIISRHCIAADAAARAIGVLQSFDVGIWLFSAEHWWLRDPNGDYVERERRTVAAEPAIISDYNSHLAHLTKIVGVSRDFDRLAECETAVKAALGASASAARSQRYYLDITPPGVDKGTVVDALARRLNIPATEIVTIGDMDNDVSMFRKSGFSIAVGNASDAARAAASVICTKTNDNDAFTEAVDRFILPRLAET